MKKAEKTAPDFNKLRALIAVGTPREVIARKFSCTVDQLEERYGCEMRRAGAMARALVGGQLFALAQEGNIAAIIFWLKTRAGWKESVRREVSYSSSLTGQKVYPRVILPCNGRGVCAKIEDPVRRRELYERALGRKLPE
jgi:hypothetical protein